MLKVNKLYNLDCRDGLSKLEPESKDCCISSPPYWKLRDYGIGDDAIGLEANFQDYITNLCDIYDQVKRVLKKSGTCFVNLGDSYGSGKGETGKKSETLTSDIKGGLDKKTKVKGFQKCLLMIPQRFAIEMINRGWILRNVIIWHKPNAMPSSAKDRFTVDFEYVYFFVKNKKYWFEQQRENSTTKFIYSRNSKKGENQEKNNPRKNWGYTREELNEITKEKSGWVKARERGIDNITPYQTEGGGKWGKPNLIPNLLGRNKRTVWTIPTKPNPEAHFATFPPNLIIPMIKSGCPEYVCKVCGKPREKIIESKKNPKRIGRQDNPNIRGLERCPGKDYNSIKKIIGYSDCGCGKGFTSGVVLDPFAGTGTTLKEAWKLGRNYIGFELSKEYCEEIAKSFLDFTKNKRLDDFLVPKTPLQSYTEKDLKIIENQKEDIYRRKLRGKKTYDTKDPYKKNFPYQKKSTI